MKIYVVAFLTAAIAASLATPLVGSFALRIGAVAQPGGRHLHRQVVPRLGGLGIYIGFFLPILVALFFQNELSNVLHSSAKPLVGLAVGGTAMCATGACDDIRGMRAMHKLLLQLACAAIAFAAGFRIEAVALPYIGPLSMGAFALPVTVFWIVGVVNAVNLIDGLDGLAAGIVLFASLTNLVVALLTGSAFVALLMSSMMGALLGFLLFNFNPARIFMGDSGSYLLGYLLATTVLLGAPSQRASAAVSLLVPCVALGVPIFDTLFTMARRFLERRPLFSPDRGHIHHRLIDMGLTQRRAVLIIYAVSIVFSVAAIGISMGKSWHAGFAILVASIVFVALIRFVGYFRYLQDQLRHRGRVTNPQAEALRQAIPRISDALASASNEVDALRAIGACVRGMPVERVELLALPQNRVIESWAKQDESGPMSRRRDWLVTRLPLGAERSARAQVAFYWNGEESASTTEITLLLQVIGEFLAQKLVQMRSFHAPENSVAPMTELFEERIPVAFASREQ